MDRLRPQKRPYSLSRNDIPLPTGAARFRRTLENSMFLHRGIAANVDVVGAVLGSFLSATGTCPQPPAPVKLDVLASGPRCYCKNIEFYGSRASFAGLRVTESGSVAGSGAQPLLHNKKSWPPAQA